jgi:hypothetical protein
MRKIIGALFLSLGFASMSTQAAPYTDPQGRLWQNAGFVQGKSWIDLAAVCDIVTGECSGIYEGKYWASLAEARSAFFSRIGLDPVADAAHVWTRAEIDVIFDTFGCTFAMFCDEIAPGGGYRYLDARTRDRVDDRVVMFGAVETLSQLGLYGSSGVSIADRDLIFGAFFYTQVPTPQSAALLGVGLLALAGAVRRRGRA